MIPELSELISNSGKWRREWRQHDPNELLNELSKLPGELPKVRRALVLSHLGRNDEADQALAGTTTPLAEGARATLMTNRIGGSQDRAAFRVVAELPELISGTSEQAMEGQLLLDQCRAQAWMFLGDLTQAGELFRSALRIARIIGSPTDFLEAKIDQLAQDPMQRALRLQGQLEIALRSQDLRQIPVIAADVADAALACLDLDLAMRATRYIGLPNVRANYSRAVAYLNGNRGNLVPEEGLQPMFVAIRALARLEQALLAKWSWDLATASRMAAQITTVDSLPGSLSGIDEELARHLLSVVKARAWIILGETEQANRELTMHSRYARMMVVTKAVGLEGALMGRTGDTEEWFAALIEAMSLLPPEWCQWAIALCARLAPNATVYVADQVDGEWRSMELKRVMTITGQLRNLGFKERPSATEQERINRIKQHLQQHPEQSLAVNSYLAPKDKVTKEL